ncbi:MAG: NAD(P)/FAD-dependent oxidoreductase [Kofleriaceae bacterium]
MEGSYWQREAGWADRWLDHEGPRRVEFAIIGGGLAGLSTAIRLREQHPAANIIVLEAERVGWGASGRNAGFLSPLAAPVWLLGAHRNADHWWATSRLDHELHAVAQWLSTTVADSELAAARYTMEGTGAVSDAGLREFAEALDRVGVAHALRSSVVRPAHLALEMTGYLVHPYRLVRGLADHASRIGVRIRERARVRMLAAERAAARIQLATGDDLVAERVVVCTNAYSSSLDVGERIRALVIHAFMVASDALDPGHGSAITRSGDFTLELDTAQAFHRMHGRRIVFGGGDRLLAPPGGDFAVPAGIHQALSRQLSQRFGPIAGVEATAAWSGRFHATTTGLPIIRASKRTPAIVLNIGYGGTGVALTLACSRLAAAVASGGVFASDEDARLLSIIHATSVPVLDGLRTIGRLASKLVRPR